MSLIITSIKWAILSCQWAPLLIFGLIPCPFPVCVALSTVHPFILSSSLLFGASPPLIFPFELSVSTNLNHGCSWIRNVI